MELVDMRPGISLKFIRRGEFILSSVATVALLRALLTCGIDFYHV